jgi:hypothetical protein
VSSSRGRRAAARFSGGEAVVEEFGDDAAAGDEVGHGDGEVAVGVGCGGDLGGVADEAFEDGEGERGDAVDDDEGIADGEGLDGGGAAGDDGGAGVVEGFAGVGDEVDVGGTVVFRPERVHHVSELLSPSNVGKLRESGIRNRLRVFLARMAAASIIIGRFAHLLPATPGQRVRSNPSRAF